MLGPNGDHYATGTRREGSGLLLALRRATGASRIVSTYTALNAIVKIHIVCESSYCWFPSFRRRSESVPVYVIYPAQRHRNPRIRRLVEAVGSNFDLFIRNPCYALIKSHYGLNANLVDG